MASSQQPVHIAPSLEQALTKGDTLAYYLQKNQPTYSDIVQVLQSVESQDAATWKELLTNGCAIQELPTKELLTFIGFLTDLLDIEELIELEATHGMFSYLLKDFCPSNVQINAIDSKPEIYQSTYRAVVERSIPDQMLRFANAKAKDQLPRTMAVQLWPKPEDEASLRSLIQKEVAAALILIGEPNGQSGISTNFDEFVKNKNYRKFQLPVKQMCFIDTIKHATATVADQGRSQVTMYLNSQIFPGFSESGFLDAFGSDSFLPHYPPDVTDKLVLQDYVVDRRIPSWIAALNGDDLSKAIEIVTSVMKTPAIFDGHIPLSIMNMKQLQFWNSQCTKLQYPLIQDDNFEAWYTQLMNLPELGLVHYRNTYNMPEYITTMKQAEQWLWARFSQKIAPPGWDASSLSLRTRFEQLWNIAQDERNVKCMAHRVPQSSAAAGTQRRNVGVGGRGGVRMSVEQLSDMLSA